MVCSRCGASDHSATACAQHEQIAQTPTATDSSRAPANNAQASNNRSAPSNAEAGNQCMTLVAVGDARMSDHDAGLDRDEPSSSAKLGRRIVEPRKLFDPEPSVSAHITAALLINPGAVASELSADVAARAFAEAPRPLPFVLPRRPPRARPLLALTCDPSSTSANGDCSSSRGGSSSFSIHAPVPKQLRDYLEPGPKETWSRSDGSRQARYGSGITASSTDSASVSEVAAAAVEASDVIDAVSEFSGIGALEHGLQAGMAEAGLKLRLLQASELDDTSKGRHNSSVLRKRFPHCSVLNPTQRLSQPYPSSTRLLTVTTLCRHHSKMNPTRSPWETEDLLAPVFERLRKSPGIETVVMENVPEFAQILDLQERSSYTMWIEGLESCGFEQHAYALLPTAAAGDLHGRTRLISVHTRACSFHPAAALSLMIDEDGESETPDATTHGTKAPKSFAFVSGLSQNRFETNGGAIRTCFGRLPASLQQQPQCRHLLGRRLLPALPLARQPCERAARCVATRFGPGPGEARPAWQVLVGQRARKHGQPAAGPRGGKRHRHGVDGASALQRCRLPQEMYAVAAAVPRKDA